jgi:hypothetical protein
VARRSSGDVRVSVGAEVSDLRRGMSEAGSLVKDFQQRAEKGGSTVRFMGDALAQLTGASEGAGRAVGLLGGALSGFAQGGAAGAAFAIVGGLVSVFREMKSESGQTAEKMKQGMKEFTSEAQKASLWLERVAYQQAGGDARVFDATRTIAGSVAEMTRLREREATVLAHIEQAHKNISVAMGRGDDAAQGILQRRLEREDENLAKVREEIKVIEDARQALLEKARTETAIEREKAATSAASKERSEKGMPSGADRIGQLYALIGELQAAQAKGEANALAQYRAQSETGALKRMQSRHGDDAAFGQQLAQQLAESQEAEKQRLKDLEGAWTTYGAAAGEALAGLVLQEKTLGQTMASVATQGLRAVLAAVRNEVMADQVAAAMKAFKANSGVPFVGLALGAAAAAAAFSFGDALLGRIPSAAGGWETPSVGGPFPAILHEDEKVLSADTSRGLDQLIAQGSRRAPQAVTVNISALDGADVYRVLTRNSAQLRDALSDLQRNGRI